MKHSALLSFLLLFFSIPVCQCKNKSKFIDKNVKFAAEQYTLQTALIEKTGKLLYPHTFIDGEIRYVNPRGWTSGFFPGSLWYLYELTGDEKWRLWGEKFTEGLDSVKYLTNHHDIGFIIGCSFGNGLRLTGNATYKNVIIRAAKSLSTRFRPAAGVIQSWNVTGGWQAERGWECPVIIDNMMNLELLFNATALSGDSSFYRIAVSHADKTIENHFRSDYSTWHVVDYDLKNGSVRYKQTAQGYADNSTWARGQAWAIYGYTVCYRETNDFRYLEQAEKAFDFVVRHPNFPEDGVPYWDFNAPDIPNALRDASAGAIMASALYELSMHTQNEDYKKWADKIMASLASSKFRSEIGENGNFLLKHCVGSIPHGSEIDVPLSYADYYFLEALTRKRNVEGI